MAADRIALEPQRYANKSPAMLGEFNALGVLYVFSQKLPPAELVEAVRASLNDDDQTVSGVSELPNGAGISARILGNSAYAVDLARTVAWNAARLALIGAPAPNLRKA